MIAKDEAHWMKKCLSHVRDLVDEIILVDTGSTDETPKIAESFGAKVFYRPWDNDFSAPRNLSLEHASCDWILVLDPDEFITDSDQRLIKKLIQYPTNCYELTQRHYTNDHRLSGWEPCTGAHSDLEEGYDGFFESSLTRLFPNNLGIEYRGYVHELVEHSIRETPSLKIVSSGVRLHHYGHTKTVNRLKDKASIYTPLGKAKIERDPNHWQNYFELGVEHNRNGNREESVVALQKAIKLRPDYEPSWLNLGYVLCELGRYQESIQALSQTLKLNPKSSEAHCNLGVVFMRMPNLHKAELHFKAAIQLNPNYVNAYCNLGKTLSLMKRFSEAANIFLQAIDISPKCVPARSDLGALYLASGVYEASEDMLFSAVKIEPDYSQPYYYLGQLYKSLQRNSEAKECLGTYCNLLRKENEIQPSEDRLKTIARVEAECLALQ
jgi:tetratricopeptide (TPR) repeat protein